MTSTTGPGLDPAPLFDLVTGFPPDDAVDLTVPMPLSLAIYMTMLESTGHPAELAVLRRIQIEQARETVRGIRARVDHAAGGVPSAPLRITHLVEQRVPGTNGLRPHIHAYVGVTARSTAGGPGDPVDLSHLATVGEAELFPAYRDRLAAVTAERLGLTWGETPWSACELVAPPVARRADRGAARRGPVLPGPLAPAADRGGTGPLAWGR